VLFPVLLWRRRARTRIAARTLARSAWRFVILGVAGLLPPSVLVAWGIARSSASDASILSLAIPVEMVLMGIFMLKERPGRLVVASLILALAGTAVISWEDIASGNFSGQTLVGNVAVLLGGAGAAFYNAYSKKLLVDYSPLDVLVYGYVVAAVLCALISGVSDKTPFYLTSDWDEAAWGGVLVLGVLVWGLAQLLWMWLLDQLELVQISVSVYISPFLSLVLSVLMLHEHVGLMELAGGVIVLLSAYLSSAPPKEAAVDGPKS
jgi:drug/metabolite transporter (DMT)-like permease